MIRRAISNDLRRISEIASNAWRINYRDVIDNNFLQSRTVENLFERGLEAKWLENKKFDTFIFEENNLQKAFISGNEHEQENCCEIGRLYVDPKYQKLGIGTKLLNYMKSYYKNIGYKKMIIWTIKGLPNNHFYRKHGKIIQEEKEYTYGDKKYPGLGFIIDLVF
jgi:GNAT superfamily N-acetyltransferase